MTSYKKPESREKAPLSQASSELDLHLRPLALRRRTSSVECAATPKSSVNTPVGLDGSADVIFSTGTNGQHVRRVTTTERDAALYSMAQALVPVLNTPEPHGKGTYWPFSAGTDLPLVPPPLAPGVLPEVRLSDFADYIRLMSDKMQNFEESRRRDQQENSQAEHRPSLLDIAEGKSVHIAGQGLVTAMEVVPSLFFSEEFSLSRPETWAAVCPTEEEEARAERAEMYEGLLDVVETQLLAEIAVRSDHFFEAAAVVQDLGSLLGRAYTHVHTLREGVHALDEDVLKAALNVQRLQRRRANLVAVAEKLKVVEDVANFQEALSLLLPQGDFAGALDVCDDLRATLASKELEGLHVARHLPQQLSKATKAINDLMESQFLALLRMSNLTAAMEESLDLLRQPTPDAKAKRGSATGGEGREEVEREALLPLVLGLWRSQRLEGALTLLREEAASHLKAALRDIVERGVPALMPLQGMDTGPETLADKLLVLTPSNFQKLLEALMAVCKVAMEHVAAVAAAVGNAMQAPGCGASKAQLASTRALCTDLVQSVADVGQQRWAKLLASRAAAHMRLRLPELTQLLTLCEDFATLSQSFGAKPGLALRNAVQVQCKAFLESLHSRSIMHLSGLLEQETWVAAEVPHQAQKLVDCLQQRASALLSDEAHLRIGPSGDMNGQKAHPSAGAEPLSVLLAAAPEGPEASSNGTLDNDTTAAQGGEAVDGSKDSSKRLAVDGSRYVVVRAELALLRLLQDYAFFQETVPTLSVEVAHRVVELVKVFNSRTCQLVLGAGAMQMAGLKSITAKHLALSAQCLGALIALMPSLTLLFTAPTPGPRRALLLPDFQRAAQDLRIHRTEIHHKLVGIMRERLAANLKQLPSISASWAASPSSPSPSQFATTIAKQIRILSQVLSPILLEQELHLIFGEVAAVFSRTLAEAFSTLDSMGPAWEAQRYTDARHLLTTLQGLPMDPKTQAAKVEQLASFCAAHSVPDRPKQSEGSAPAHDASASPKAASQRTVDAAHLPYDAHPPGKAHAPDEAHLTAGTSTRAGAREAHVIAGAHDAREAHPAAGGAHAADAFRQAHAPLGNGPSHERDPAREAERPLPAGQANGSYLHPHDDGGSAGGTSHDVGAAMDSGAALPGAAAGHAAAPTGRAPPNGPFVVGQSPAFSAEAIVPMPDISPLNVQDVEDLTEGNPGSVPQDDAEAIPGNSASSSAAGALGSAITDPAEAAFGESPTRYGLGLSESPAVDPLEYSFDGDLEVLESRDGSAVPPADRGTSELGVHKPAGSLLEALAAVPVSGTEDGTPAGSPDRSLQQGVQVRSAFERGRTPEDDGVLLASMDDSTASDLLLGRAYSSTNRSEGGDVTGQDGVSMAADEDSVRANDSHALWSRQHSAGPGVADWGPIPTGSRAMSRMSSAATDLTYARRESGRSELMIPDGWRSVSMRSTLDVGDGVLPIPETALLCTPEEDAAPPDAFETAHRRSTLDALEEMSNPPDDSEAACEGSGISDLDPAPDAAEDGSATHEPESGALLHQEDELAGPLGAFGADHQSMPDPHSGSHGLVDGVSRPLGGEHAGAV